MMVDLVAERQQIDGTCSGFVGFFHVGFRFGFDFGLGWFSSGFELILSWVSWWVWIVFELSFSMSFD